MKLTRFLPVMWCLLGLPLLSSAQFTLLYPAVSNDQAVDLVFVNNSTGFFSNAAGSIFMTTDGGLTWTRRAHCQGDPVTMLRFVDRSLGFGASPHSNLWLDKVNCLYTTDGGVWWSRADVDFNDAMEFLPLSASVFLKGTATGIERLANVYGAWVQTYSIPYFVPVGSDIGMAYGTVRQLLRRPGGNAALALVSYENARQMGIVSDSINVLLRSTDEGATWDTLWMGSRTIMNAAAFVNDSVGWMGGFGSTFLKSTDGGMHWAVQFTDSLSVSRIQQIIAIDSLRVFAVSQDGRVFRTTTGGVSWSSVAADENGDCDSNTRRRIAFINPMKGFYAGSALYETTDGGLTWAAVFPRIHDYTVQMEFLNRRLGWVLGSQALYASTDGGNSWAIRSSLPASFPWTGFDMIDSLAGWALRGSEYLKTTDGGTTWSARTLDYSLIDPRGVKFFNKDLGVVFEASDLSPYACNLVTTNGGETWIKRSVTNRQYPSYWSKMKFTGPGHLWFANQQGLWHSRDSATTWSVVTADSVYSSYVFDVQDTVHATCEIFPRWLAVTSDAGASWERFEKPYMNQALDMAILGRTYSAVRSTLVVGEEGSIFEEREDGNPMNVYDSYTMAPLNSISVYREGNVADVWILGATFEILHTQYTFPDAVAEPQALPAIFQLFGNFPNPFNPSTTIRYGLPVRAAVTLIIYDVLGRQVSQLCDDVQEAGIHEVRYEASRLSTGVYFCRMTAHDADGSRGAPFTQTCKIMVLK